MGHVPHIPFLHLRCAVGVIKAVRVEFRAGDSLHGMAWSADRVFDAVDEWAQKHSLRPHSMSREAHCGLRQVIGPAAALGDRAALAGVLWLGLNQPQGVTYGTIRRDVEHELAAGADAVVVSAAALGVTTDRVPWTAWAFAVGRVAYDLRPQLVFTRPNEVTVYEGVPIPSSR